MAFGQEQSSIALGQKAVDVGREQPGDGSVPNRQPKPRASLV
jgi:hypothetical protein